MAAPVSIVFQVIDNTAAGFRALSQRMGAVQKDLRATAASFATFGASITVALGGAVIAAQRYGEELDKANKITGISVEQLAKLKFAAEQEHASLESLSTGIRFLSQSMVEAQKATSQSAAVFRALQIDTRNADGTLRAADAVLMEVADRMRGLTNDATRTALAIQLFGRSGTELIPFLRQGSQAIREQGQQAKDLGLVWGRDMINAAEAFGDNVTKLRASLRGLSLQIGVVAIPALNDWTQRATVLVAQVVQWTAANPELTRTIVGVTAAVGGLSIALAGLATIVPRVIAGFTLLATAARALTGPLALAAGAVGALQLGLGRAASDLQKFEVLVRRGLATSQDLARAANGEMAVRERLLRTYDALMKVERARQEQTVRSTANENLGTDASRRAAEIQAALGRALAGTTGAKKKLVQVTDEFVKATAAEAAAVAAVETLRRGGTTRDASIASAMVLQRFGERDALQQVAEAIADLYPATKQLTAEEIRELEILKALAAARFRLATDTATYADQLREAQQAEEDWNRQNEFDARQQSQVERGLMRQIDAHRQRIALMDDGLEKRRAEAAGIEQVIQAVRQETDAIQALIKAYTEAGLPTEALTASHERLKEILSSLVHDSAMAARALQQQMSAPLREFIDATERAFGELFTNVLSGAKSFGDTITGFFRSIVNAIISSLARLAASWIVRMLFSGLAGGAGGLGIVGPIIAGAHGGIMPGGFTPLRAFQSGGVVTRPTMGLVGEGGQNEAVVPLPDGRSIPVDMRGQGQDREQAVPINLNIYNVLDRSSLPAIPGPNDIINIVGADMNSGGLTARTVRRVVGR